MIKESYFLVDTLAQKENVFNRVDARIKMFFAAVAIILLLIIPGIKFPLLIISTNIVAYALMRIPRKMIVSRIIPCLFLTSVVVVLDTLLLSGTPFFQLHIGNWLLQGHWEGMLMGLALSARIIGSVSMMLFLSFSTPVNELIVAAAWFRIPKTLVEIFMLTYRYLFVFWDEGLRIRQAQTLRLGYPNWKSLGNWKKAMKSTSTLLGMVLIRAYDRAESTYQAMQVRGYKGNIIGKVKNEWTPAQWKYSAIATTLLLAFIVISYR